MAPVKTTELLESTNRGEESLLEQLDARGFPSTSPSSWMATAAGRSDAICPASPATAREWQSARTGHRDLREAGNSRADALRLLDGKLAPAPKPKSIF